jgi:hypothetical protein
MTVIRKLNHKGETVRIRIRGLEAFMRWVVVSSQLNALHHPNAAHLNRILGEVAKPGSARQDRPGACPHITRCHRTRNFQIALS